VHWSLARWGAAFFRAGLRWLFNSFQAGEARLSRSTSSRPVIGFVCFSMVEIALPAVSCAVIGSINRNVDRERVGRPKIQSFPPA